jgi:preprotein translocase subunit SecD
MDWLRDLRFIILALLLMISAYLLLSPMIFKKSGVVVTLVESGSKCSNVQEGSIITRVGSANINNVDDYTEILKQIKSGDFVTLLVNGGLANCIAIKNNSIGLVVKNVQYSNLKFGIDVEGGTRVLLQPKTNVTSDVMAETIKTLQVRMDVSGLRDMRIVPIGQNLIQIEMAGSVGDEIRNFLAKQGKFEGKIAESIKFVNNTGKIILGDNNYFVELTNGKIKINDTEYFVNDSFVLEDIQFDVYNITNNSAIIMANIFSGKDIVAVLTDPQHSRLYPVDGRYDFSFTVQITKEGARRFAKVTKNQPIVFGMAEQYIEPRLVLFLDGVPVSELNIASSLAGQEITTPAITGSRSTREQAFAEKIRLQSILRSGSLPVELEISKVDTITQTAGKELVNSTVYVALAAALAVSVIILVRYRDLKIAIPMILISFSEIILILGFAAFTQVLTGGNGWTLDIPAIAGLIAVIGTGVNQLIIITDQIILEPEQSLKQRHRTATSIIFNSAYIVIAAMIPLIILGIGTLRGFAITTIVGVLIGLLITRPAYTVILERIKGLTF